MLICLCVFGILVYDDLTLVTEDRNRDGKIDEWIHLNIFGEVQKYERDKSRDGKPDVIEYYRDGVIDWLRSDYDYDGFMELVAVYKDGKLQCMARDNNKDGKFDKVSFYRPKSEAPYITIVDDNGDGKWDRRRYLGFGWEALTPDAKMPTAAITTERDTTDYPMVSAEIGDK